MLRALGFLVVLGLLVALAVWMADHPGSASLDWQGYRVETSFVLLLGAIAALAVATALLYRLWLFIRRVPGQLVRAHREGRRRKGYLALTRGMVAVAAGDADEAGRQVKRAEVLLNDPPLTMLLSAQAAQLAGDEQAAGRFFTAMLERPETEFLGLRGLLTQAIKRDDGEEALGLARRAYHRQPASTWVASSLFDLQIRAGQWAEALDTLTNSARKDRVTPADSQRRKAVLRYQVALEAAARGEDAEALRSLRKAHELDPALVPAALELACRLVDAGKERKAISAIEKVWGRSPHPGLVETYCRARRAADPLARMQAVQQLIAANPGHTESHIAAAAAALEAKLWGEAGKYLETVAGDGAPGRVCRLMARLEEAGRDNPAGAREWLIRASMAEADPAWVCGHCGHVSARWSALCAKCAEFDTLAWGTPPGLVAVLDQRPESAQPAALGGAEAVDANHPAQ